jgi:hypothetical protein
VILEKLLAGCFLFPLPLPPRQHHEAGHCAFDGPPVFHDRLKACLLHHRAAHPEARFRLILMLSNATVLGPALGIQID